MEEEKSKIINMIENEFENNYLDFKLELYDFSSDKKKEDFLVDMMSLANSNFAGDRYLIIGARDVPKRIIRGINKNELKDSSVYYQFINENIEPSINFEILNIEYNSKDFVIYKIPYKELNRPYLLKKDYKTLLKGTCRIRKGSQNSFITRYDLDEIYNKASIKKSDLIIKCLDKGEVIDKLDLQQFNFNTSNNELKEKALYIISNINNINIDDISEVISNIPPGMFEKHFIISKEEKEIIENFLKENKININDDFFYIGNAGYIQIPFNDITYSGSRKSVKKYKMFEDLIEIINDYYGFLDFKKKLNKLYFLDFALCNVGNYYDENIDITIKIPKVALVTSQDFPIPNYHILEKYKDSIVEKLYQIEQTYNTKKYDSDIYSDQSFHLQESLPSMLGVKKDSYEELVYYYKEDIKYNFDYEITEKDDFLYLKHTHKGIKSSENIIFPSRIFLNKKIEEVEYIINSKFSDNIKINSIKL